MHSPSVRPYSVLTFLKQYHLDDVRPISLHEDNWERNADMHALLYTYNSHHIPRITIVLSFSSRFGEY